MRGKKGPVPDLVAEPETVVTIEPISNQAGIDLLNNGFEVESQPQPELFNGEPATVTRSLQVHISDERLKELHEELGALASEMLEQKELQELAKDRAKALETDMQTVRAKIRQPYEWQEVACQWVVNIEDNSKSLYRNDTDEVIDTKPLSEEDRAAELAKAQAENQPEVQTAGA